MDSIPVRSLPQDHGVDENNLHAYGTARSTVKDQPLSHDEVELFNKYFYSSMYLCLGMVGFLHATWRSSCPNIPPLDLPQAQPSSH